jgi:hypothetical protein
MPRVMDSDQTGGVTDRARMGAGSPRRSPDGVVSQHVVVCATRSDCLGGGHVTHIRTAATKGASERAWTVDEVWAAIDCGDTFFIARDTMAVVEKWVCECLDDTLRATPSGPNHARTMFSPIVRRL